MKRLLILASCLAALSAQAQLIGRYGSNPIITGGTNNVINLASNSYSIIINVQDVNDVGISISATLVSSNFCKPRLDFMQSVDGTSWTSTNLVVVSCLGGISTNDLCAGTSCYYTNLDVRGLQSLKFFRLANTDYHGIMSNVTVTVSTKR